MKYIPTTLTLSVLLPIASLQAAVLLTYDFNGASDGDAVPFTADRPTTTQAGDNPSGTLAGIATEFTAASNFGTEEYDNESTGTTDIQMKGSGGTTTASTAVANNAFFEFTVNFQDLNPGEYANLTSLDFIAAKSGSGDRGFFITTNGNGFGYDAPSDAGYVNTTAGSTFVSYDLNVDSTRATNQASKASYTSYSLDLTGSDFQNLTQAVTFRLYPTSGNAGQTVQFDDFQLNGAVIPEPGTLALAGLAGLAILVSRLRRRGR